MLQLREGGMARTWEEYSNVLGQFVYFGDRKSWPSRVHACLGQTIRNASSPPSTHTNSNY